MLSWILIGIAVYYVAVMTPSTILIPQIGLGSYLGPRDTRPEIGQLEGRAKRAVDNLRESFPVFLALGALAFVIPAADIALATTGAAIFVVARAAYHIVYLMGIPLLRSAIWTVGAVGLGIMAFALI